MCNWCDRYVYSSSNRTTSSKARFEVRSGALVLELETELCTRTVLLASTHTQSWVGMPSPRHRRKSWGVTHNAMLLLTSNLKHPRDRSPLTAHMEFREYHNKGSCRFDACMLDTHAKVPFSVRLLETRLIRECVICERNIRSVKDLPSTHQHTCS